MAGEREAGREGTPVRRPRHFLAEQRSLRANECQSYRERLNNCKNVHGKAARATSKARVGSCAPRRETRLRPQRLQSNRRRVWIEAEVGGVRGGVFLQGGTGDAAFGVLSRHPGASKEPRQAWRKQEARQEGKINKRPGSSMSGGGGAGKQQERLMV